MHYRSTSGQCHFTISYGDGSGLSGPFGYDTMDLGGGMSLMLNLSLQLTANSAFFHFSLPNILGSGLSVTNVPLGRITAQNMFFQSGSGSTDAILGLAYGSLQVVGTVTAMDRFFSVTGYLLFCVFFRARSLICSSDCPTLWVSAC